MHLEPTSVDLNTVPADVAQAQYWQEKTSEDCSHFKEMLSVCSTENRSRRINYER